MSSSPTLATKQETIVKTMTEQIINPDMDNVRDNNSNRNVSNAAQNINDNPNKNSSISSSISSSTITPNKIGNSESDFTVIWHNLTYRVDSRPWHTKLKEKFFTTSNNNNINYNNKNNNNKDFSNIEDGRYSGSSNFDANSNHQSISTTTTTTNLCSPRERIILNQVCGSTKSRQLTAIMGPSGAGKSSLLHCLFQNRTAGTSGRILVESKNKSKLKVCFIPQSDYLNEWLTVREDLIFVSRLKLAKVNYSLFKKNNNDRKNDNLKVLDKLSQNNNNNNIFSNNDKNSSYVRQIGNECNTSLIDHEANAIRVAELLGLTNCLDVVIKNISGGQKKRLSIARELMSKPDILILDEPTTGLDSLTCYKTIMVLKDLAHLSPNPMAVVVTIHQPQREVFNLFDKTYFLSNTGRVIYENNPKCAVDIINKIAKVQLPQPNYNPASFLIELASDSEQQQQLNCIDRLAKYQTSKFYENYDLSYLKQLMRSKSNGNNNNNSNNISNWKFCTLEQRDSLNSCEDNNNVNIESGKQFQLQLNKTYSFNNNTTNSLINNNNVESIDDNLSSTANNNNLNTDAKQISSSSMQSMNTNYPYPSNNNNNKFDNQYFISYQLSNCLSSHSNNLLQSFRHIFILTHRSWLSVIRNPTFTKSRLLFHTLLPLFMLLIFGTTSGSPNNCPKLDSQVDFQELSKSIKDGSIAKNFEETRLCVENVSFFFILMYGFGINIISCTASFYPLTMRMYKKETINGLYSPLPYFIGQMLAELPLEILLPSISVFLSYSLTGQISSFLAWRMFAIAYIVFLVSYCIHSLGLLCGSIFINNVSVAVLTGQISLFPWILLSGFIIRPSRMSDLMVKASYFSPFKLGLSAITAARYGFDVCDCDEDMLPEDGESIKFSGMTPHLKNVLHYLFSDKNNNSTILTETTTSNLILNGTTNSIVKTIASQHSNIEEELDITEVLDKLSEKFIKAQTFALDLNSCDDVKPFIMHVFKVENSDLFISVLFLISIIAVFKLITFSIMKSFPYRMT